MGVVRVAAADGVEEELAQAHGNRAGDAVADRSPVDAGDRRDLDTGATEERLIDDVELGAVDVALLNWDSSSRANCIIVRRVIPSRMSPVIGR